MSCVAVLEGHTLQRVQCRRLALRLPGPCARATGAASPWGTLGVPHLAHISLSPSTWRLQPPLCHGVSGQRGTGGLLGAPCAARSRAGTPGAPAVLALPACGSRGGSGAAPCPVGSAPTLCWRPPRPPALPQWGVCRRPRGTNGHIVGGSRGQPRGPPHPGLSVPKAVSLLDGESTLPPRSPCSPERGRDPLAGEKPPDVPSVPPSRPRRWSLGLGGGEGAAAPRGPASGSHTGGGRGALMPRVGPPIRHAGADAARGSPRSVTLGLRFSTCTWGAQFGLQHPLCSGVSGHTRCPLAQALGLTCGALAAWTSSRPGASGCCSVPPWTCSRRS